MDCRIEVASCKEGNGRLLNKVFESKPIKREGKILFQQFKEIIYLNFKHMSLQITNNYRTVSTSPNPYISRRLNNMNEVQAMKKEQDDWIELYHKTMKELEAMIDMQKQVRKMMKIAGEANITIIEIESNILKASINNQTINTTNIAGILEDLWYLIQNNIKDWVFQIQRMLADKLNIYKR